MTRIKIKISTLTEEHINIYTTDIFVLFSIKFGSALHPSGPILMKKTAKNSRLKN